MQVATGATFSSSGKEWVYARGWGWCGKDILPKYSALEVCLVIELPAEDFAAADTQEICETEESGYNKQGEARPLSQQLYAHVHVRYEGNELTYQAWGYFWIGGEYGYKNKAKTEYGQKWQCGQETTYFVVEFLVLLAEFFPSSPTPRE